MYDHSNYGGRLLTLSQQNAHFANDFFNDRVESIRLHGTCKWLFYEHANFLGSSHLLQAGYFASAPGWGGSGNRISSARALPPSGTTAILLFDHANFSGRMLMLYASSSHLPTLDFSDHISSVIVTGGHWTLFQHTDYQGTHSAFGVGEYPNIHSTSVGGDSVSSVRRD